MPDLAIDLRSLGAQTGLKTDWLIRGHPDTYTDGTQLWAAGTNTPSVFAVGCTDPDGADTATLPHTPSDGVYYELALSAKELPKRRWLFQYRASDPAAWSLAEHAAAYSQRYPDGHGVEYVPTPGPEGPQGVRGDQGVRGFQGLRGHQGNTGAAGPRGVQGVQGTRGTDGTDGAVGPEGSSPLYIFKVITEGATEPIPVGGTYDTDTGAFTPPAGWGGPTIPAFGQELVFSYTIVHHTHVGVIVPVWSAVGLSGGQGVPGATGATGPRGIPGTHGTDGSDGTDGVDGTDGTDGFNGWSPDFATVIDGDRVLLQLVAWFGGTGAHPGGIGEYVSLTGLTSHIADAQDFRGLPGLRRVQTR